MNVFSYWNIPVGFDHMEDLERLLGEGNTLRFASPPPPAEAQCYVTIRKKDDLYRVEVRRHSAYGTQYTHAYQTLTDLWRSEPYDLIRFQVVPPKKKKQ